MTATPGPLAGEQNSAYSSSPAGDSFEQDWCELTTYAVTGGAGFIGSHLAGALVDGGARVVVLDNLSTGKEANLDQWRGRVDLRLIDVALAPPIAALEGIDVVFHQAAVPSVPLSVNDPAGTHAANLTGTLNVLIAAHQAGVRRVVCASSSAIFGEDPALPKTDSMPAAPISPYGAQKYCSEMYAQTFWRAYGLETVCLRYFNVFGPRQDASSQYSGVMARFIPAILRKEQPVIYGDGDQSRDFIFVSDIVTANIRAAEATAVAGECFNVARGESTTVNELLSAIQSVLGTSIAPRYDSARSGDIRHSQADPSRAMQSLAWEPSTTLTAGLIETAEWYRSEIGRG